MEASKLIKLSPTHYVVVKEADITMGDYMLSGEGVHKMTLPLMTRGFKVTHSTMMYEFDKDYNVGVLSLYQIQELLSDYNINETVYTKMVFDESDDEHWGVSIAWGAYKQGFLKHQELSDGKKFTVEDMKKAIDMI